MADLFGIDLAYIALFVTMIGTGAGITLNSWASKRATVKEVKEHTDLRINSATSILNSKLETIEYKVNNQEKLLEDIKRVNKDEVFLIKKELQDLRSEMTEIEKYGPTATIRAENVEKRLDNLERKLDYLMERAFGEVSRKDIADKKAPV